MKQKECVAMLLAGGEGKRLGVLTSNLAKPAVHFGGRYRIIDFTLSNCSNSGIDTVGVLTQYQPAALHNHLGSGEAWGLDHQDGGMALLPPYAVEGEMQWYKGTAHAVYQNLKYIEQYHPEYVLVISGDHIYNMDYNQMLEFHKQKQADATISVVEVKWEEASRFGIMNADGSRRITEFAEKPAQPKSNLASMGIYIFNWEFLKTYLQEDLDNPKSNNDFGQDIIPAMLEQGSRLYAYPFKGYWKDVGTIDSLWEAHMDLLDNKTSLQLDKPEWPLYSSIDPQTPHFVSAQAKVMQSMVSNGCVVQGAVHHSVLFQGAEVGEGSIIRDSIIMPNVKIGKDVIIHKAIIGEGSVIMDGTVIADPEGVKINVVGDNEVVYKEADKLPKIFVPRSKVLLERIG